jgi:hypothetical protein
MNYSSWSKVPTSKKKVSITKIRWLMSNETAAVYSENHTKHINVLFGQNKASLNVKTGGTYRPGYHTA